VKAGNKITVYGQYERQTEAEFKKRFGHMLSNTRFYGYLEDLVRHGMWPSSGVDNSSTGYNNSCLEILSLPHRKHTALQVSVILGYDTISVGNRNPTFRNNVVFSWSYVRNVLEEFFLTYRPFRERQRIASERQSDAYDTGERNPHLQLHKTLTLTLLPEYTDQSVYTALSS
jgi:hypothetical protein